MYMDDVRTKIRMGGCRWMPSIRVRSSFAYSSGDCRQIWFLALVAVTVPYNLLDLLDLLGGQTLWISLAEALAP